MATQLEIITSIIKEQIRHFNEKSKTSEEGKVLKIGDGICLIYGLNNAMLGELIIFSDNVYGMVCNLEETTVSVMVMGDDSNIKEGNTVKRTKKVVEVPVGDGLLGRVVNALGEPIDGLGTIKYSKKSPIESPAPGIMDRQSVTEPLETGIKIIDSMVPIGKGQRELIIGDRQTGKTAICIDAIINQRGKDVICVYVAIGQKNSTVVQIVEKLKENKSLDYTVIVSASASDLAPLQYLSAYTGVTIAEEWMHKGKDVLIIYDDLSKHAVAYRTISLLLRRPPGREAYPGDVFYLHSRLLERSAKLSDENGGGSITSLPIIETQSGDISAYIPTNVISITDGQIFLNADYFKSNIRPAVNSGTSVSRVGGSAQIPIIKKMSSKLKLELSSYKELQTFSQFGSDVDESTKIILAHGERVVEILKQKQYSPCDQIDLVIILFVIQEKYISKIPLEKINEYKEDLVSEYQKSKVRNMVSKEKDFTEVIEKELNEFSKKFTDKFLLTIDPKIKVKGNSKVADKSNISEEEKANKDKLPNDNNETNKRNTENPDTKDDPNKKEINE